MKKNLLAIALGSVIALTAAPYSLAANDSTIQSSADYSQLVTKRQVVDQLLNDAVEAFKSCGAYLSRWFYRENAEQYGDSYRPIARSLPT